MAEKGGEERTEEEPVEEVREEEPKERYVDVFSDEDVEVEAARGDDVGDALLRTYSHEVAEALDELVGKIFEALESPLIVDGSIVLCRQPHLVEVQGSDPAAYAIRGVDGLWVDTGFVAYNAYEAYRHAGVHVARGAKAAIVLRGKTYAVLVRSKLPARFAYSNREALVL